MKRPLWCTLVGAVLCMIAVPVIVLASIRNDYWLLSLGLGLLLVSRIFD